MKKLSRAFVVAAVLAFAVGLGAAKVEARTASDIAALQTQIQALLQQVQALQAQVQARQGTVSPFPTVGVTGSPAACITVQADLAQGSRGAAVTALQRALHNVGAYTGPVTGYFGPLTRAAVSAFQGENGFSATGNVDAVTASAVNRLSCPDHSSASTLPPPVVPTPLPLPSPYTTSTATSTLTVTYPTGGLSFQAGGQMSVTFTGFKMDSSYVVDLQFVPVEQNYRLGTVVGPRADQYRGSFLVPVSAAAGTYRVRVSEMAQGGNVAYSGNFTIASARTPASPSLTVLSPNGGERLEIGKSYTVRWTSLNIPTDAKIVITYEPAYGPGRGHEAYSVGETTNTGFYSWTVPLNAKTGEWIINILASVKANTPSGTEYFEDRGDAPFSIVSATSAQPSLTVLSPNGGEVWKVGETRRITWRAQGVDQIQIDLYDSRITGSGAIIRTIAAYQEVSPSQGYYDWTIPDSVLWNNDGKNFTIHIYDGGWRSDTSDHSFTIQFANAPALSASFIQAVQTQLADIARQLQVIINQLR